MVEGLGLQALRLNAWFRLRRRTLDRCDAIFFAKVGCHAVHEQGKVLGTMSISCFLTLPSLCLVLILQLCFMSFKGSPAYWLLVGNIIPI